MSYFQKSVSDLREQSKDQENSEENESSYLTHNNSYYYWINSKINLKDISEKMIIFMNDCRVHKYNLTKINILILNQQEKTKI